MKRRYRLVEHAIAQLRHSPSPATRSLASRRTRTFGLIAPAVSDDGPTRIGMPFEGLLRQRVDAIMLIVMDIGVLEMVRSLDLSRGG